MLKKLIGLIVVLALVGVAAWYLSPWPSALFYRYVFDKAGIAANNALAKHVPAGVIVRRDIAYGPEPIEKLDVYLPPGIEDSTRRLPVIFWIHGGAFLAGDKNHQANYMQILAA